MKQGNKPDFHLAMGGEESKLLYDQLLAGLRKGYKENKVQTGVFGAMMQVGASISTPLHISKTLF